MELMKLAEEIYKKIKDLDSIRGVIKDRGEMKANAISQYDKSIAITIIKLKNGESFKLGGEDVINPAVTIIEKLAKGICYNEKLEMEKCDAMYKSAITNMQAVLAQLNALQSLFRHLENV